MELQTIITPENKGITLSHHDRIVLVGSCFTHSIGEKLSYFGFHNRRNPFGILYNPVSIAQCLDFCIENRPIPEDLLVFHNHRWHSWLHHSSFSNASKEACLTRCNREIEETHEFLKSASTLIITWGTAFVYTVLESGVSVGNCHKMPGSAFEKRLGGIEEFTNGYRELLKKLYRFNPHLQIVFTVSPIRHWKDGFRQNQLSKSILHLTINQLQAEYEHLHYFPAYEIVMDELRDYRFYDSDMLHPSALAVEYIWEKFAAAYFHPQTSAHCKGIDKLRKMQQHRPLFPDSPDYQKHLEKIKKLEAEFASKIPNPDLS